MQLEINDAHKQKGFTLIEMLLVLVIVSAVIYMALGFFQQRALQQRIDRTSVVLQQILNAGMAYYVANGSWPTDLPCLQGSGGALCTQKYLPTPLVTPWGDTPVIASTRSNLYVSTMISAGTPEATLSYATLLANNLPLAFTTKNVTSPAPSSQTTCNTTSCYVVASVIVPGQNLNNASAINFAGIYHHGACVPVPTCPVDANNNTMTPQIFVVPISVAGRAYNTPSNLYPLTSFNAYVMPQNTTPTNNTPLRCIGATTAPPSCLTNISGNAASRYWRVCLQVSTTEGYINQTRTNQWGVDASIAAFTRCAISNEASGSTLTVFSN